MNSKINKILNLLSQENNLSFNIEDETIKNTLYRKIIYTDKHFQLALMSIKIKQEIGLESHEGHTQFIRVENGTGKAIIDDKTYALKDGSIVIIPSGTLHNIINTSLTDNLQIYTIYSPPVHKV